MTRTPSVRERVAQFMEAMHRQDFAEAKRIRKFTRSMCSPQHWSTECRLWLERNPDAALNKWFEQAAADLKVRLEGPKSYMATRKWTPEQALLDQSWQTANGGSTWIDGHGKPYNREMDHRTAGQSWSACRAIADVVCQHQLCPLLTQGCCSIRHRKTHCWPWRYASFLGLAIPLTC